MRPLLRIQTIPISFEVRTTRARLVPQDSPPVRPNVTRSRGNASIQTTPSQLNLDTFETRASAGLRSASRVIAENAEDGRQAAMEATRRFVEEGNQMMEARGRGNPVADIAMQRTMRTAETIMAFIPSVPPQIDGVPGTVAFDYTMDQFDFDWSALYVRPQMEFVPGGIEVEILQFPQVIIEWIGSPRFVPPSSNPEYAG